MNTFLAVFNAFPSILNAVQAVEAAVPISQSGQQKMNLVLGATATAWEMSQIQQQVSKSQMLNAVMAMSNLIVAGLNTSGVFHRGHLPAVPAATPAVASAVPVSSK